MTEETITAPLPLAAGAWTLDTAHAVVGFTVRHLGISKVRGRFAAFDATLTVGETLDQSAVTATVELASIDTGNTQRDEHVRSADILDVEKRPTMTFRSTRIHGQDADWTLAGDLTIGGVTRPVEFEVEFGGVEDFVAAGSRRAGFEATGAIKGSDFGMGFGSAVLSDTVKIQLDLQFIAPG